MNRKFLSVLMILLAVFVFAAAGALADDVNAITLSVKDVEIENGAVSGQYYYMVTVTLPDDVEFEDGWSLNVNDTEPYEWNDRTIEDYGGENNSFTVCCHPGDSSTDKYFIRLKNIENNKQSLVFNYKQDEINNRLATSGLSLDKPSPVIRQPVTLSWNPVEGGADQYCVIWMTPNETFDFYTADNYLNIDYGLRNGPLGRTMGTVGSYSAQVIPFKDGKKGIASEAYTFTVSSIGSIGNVPTNIPITIEAGNNLEFAVTPAVNAQNIPEETNIYYNIFVDDLDTDQPVYEAHNERKLDEGDDEVCLLTETKTFTVYADKNNATNNQCWVQSESLVPGHTYSIYLEAFAMGYIPLVKSYRVFVHPETTPSLSLTIDGDNGENGPVEVAVNSRFKAKVSVPEGVTALRYVWDGNWKDYERIDERELDEDRTTEFSQKFGDTTRRAVYVQATYDPVPDNTNWNSLTWSAISNVVAVQPVVTGTLAQHTAVLENANNTVHRRDDVVVSFTNIDEKATNVSLQVHTADEENWDFPWEEHEISEGPVFHYRTNDLYPGEYVLHVESYAPGYVASESDHPFTVTGLGGLTHFDYIEYQFLRSNGTKVKFPSVVGAKRYELFVEDVKNDYNRVFFDDTVQHGDEITIPATTFSHEGIYQIVVLAYNDIGDRTGWAAPVYAYDGEALPEDEVTLIFDGSKQASGEDGTALVYAKGAAFVDLYLDGEHYAEMDCDDEKSGIFFSWVPFDKPGEYNLHAVAYYLGDTEEWKVSNTVTYTVGTAFPGAKVGTVNVDNLPTVVPAGQGISATLRPVTEGVPETVNVHYNVRLEDMDEDWRFIKGWDFDSITDDEEDLIGSGQTLAISKDELQPGHHYCVNVSASAYGYEPSFLRQSFFVTDQTAAANVQLTVDGVDDAATLAVGQDVRIYISAPEATAIRFWDGYGYQYLNFRDEWWNEEDDWQHHPESIEMGWRFGDTMARGVYIQATSEEIDDEERERIEKADGDYWGSLNWKISNVVKVTLKPSEKVGAPVVSLPEEPVTRGEFLPVTIVAPGEDAEWMEIYAIGYENGRRPEYTRVHVDLSQTENAYPMTVNYPTVDLNTTRTGWYILRIETGGENRQGRTMELPFDVKDWTLPTDILFTVGKTNPFVGEHFSIQAYVPGAHHYQLLVRPEWNDEDDKDWDWERRNGNETLSVEKQFDDAGSYDLFLRVWYGENELQYVDSEKVRMTVGVHGVLTAATIKNAPQTLKQSDGPLTFRVSGLIPEAPYATWRYWEIRVEDLDEEVEDEDGKHPKAVVRITSNDDVKLDEEGGYDVEIPWKNEENEPVFEVGHTYQICTWVDAGGYTGSDSFWQFFAYDSQTEDVVLKIYDQEGNEATEFPASSLFTIEISAPGADEVEFFNGEEWREAERNSYDPKTDTYSFGYSHNSGTVSYFARARYGETWTDISNIVTVTFVSQGSTEAVIPQLPDEVIENGILLGEELPVTFPAAVNPDNPETAHMFITSIQEVRPDGRREGTPVMAFIPVPDRSEAVTPKLSTEDLTPGRTYVVAVETAADGYDRSYKESEPFRVYSLGVTPPVEPALNKDTLKQGEMLKVTIPAKTGEDIATRFYSYVTDSSDEWREHEFSTDWDPDFDPERERDYSYTVGTGDLNPGNYVLVLESRAPGYAMSRKKVPFTIEKLGENETLFSFEEADQYIPSVGYGVYVCAPGAERIELYKHKQGEEEPWRDDETNEEILSTSIGFDSGTYTVFAKAWYKDGDEEGVLIGSVGPFDVVATEIITPPMLFPKSPTVFTLSEDFKGFTFEVALPEGQSHQSWELTLEDRTDDWNQVWKVRGDDWDRWEDIADEWTIPAKCFTVGHSYDLVARLWKRGCDTAETRISLLVQDPGIVSEDLKLLAGRKEDDRTHTVLHVLGGDTIYMQVQITLPEGKEQATILEVFDGEEWSNPVELEMDEERSFTMRAGANGTYSYVARATFDDFDWDWSKVDDRDTYFHWIQSEPVTVIADAELEAPSVSLDSVIGEEDLQENGLTIACNSVENSEKYDVIFKHMNGDGQEEAKTISLSPGSLSDGIITIDPNKLQDVLKSGNWYKMTIEVSADGWKPNKSKGAYFAVVDPEKVLTLPKGLTAVRENAFRGSGAQAVVFQSEVTTVGNGAFIGCDNLCVIVVPEGMFEKRLINKNNASEKTMVVTPDEWPFN